MATAPTARLTVRSLLQARGADALAVGVRPGDGGPRVPGGRDLERRYGVVLADELALARATGKVGEVVAVPVSEQGDDAEVLLLVGTGDGSPTALRRAGAALARRAGDRARLATAVAAGASPDGLRAHVEGVLLATYRFRDTGKAEGAGPLRRVDVVSSRAESDKHRAAFAAAVRGATAAFRARDLANTTSDVKDPAWVVTQARRLARPAGLDVKVWDERDLAREGFGGILAVGQGSARPPRLLQLTYSPSSGARTAPHVVLVGKGITFDSGGLTLKPREALVPMKTDMAAGGAVVAAMAALKEAGTRARVTALVPLAENLPGAAAQRPGDVIRHWGGRTVEVFNTDAEGRLVLADALAYAAARLRPDLVVDLATLTGAASLGLGRRHGALYATDEGLAAGLLAAGEATGERLWRMPLVDDYRFVLDSELADLTNVTRDPTVMGGSIVAALFLREFTGGLPWAHLDIAGPARADKNEHEVTKGATGFGARLLLRWLETV